MAIIVITGGSGLIGQALTRALVSKGDEVVILTRNKAKVPLSIPGVRYAEWNIEQQRINRESIEQADYIIHLAGASVAEKRWTNKRKNEIRDSRVKSGALLVKALNEIPNKVQAVVSASGIGRYGQDGGHTAPYHRERNGNKHAFVETDPPADDFLGRTCQQWEAAIQPVLPLGKRLVILRTGIVLSQEGGAYPEFKMPLRFGIAAILGNGRQIVSWIHIDDLVQLYITALENNQWNGVYNAVAPHAVSNELLIREMAKARRRFHFTVHVPQLALKIASGEMSIEVLKSTTVSAEKVIKMGFQSRYPTIDSAIRQLEAL